MSGRRRLEVLCLGEAEDIVILALVDAGVILGVSACHGGDGEVLLDRNGCARVIAALQAAAGGYVGAATGTGTREDLTGGVDTIPGRGPDELVYVRVEPDSVVLGVSTRDKGEGEVPLSAGDCRKVAHALEQAGRMAPREILPGELSSHS